MTRDFDAEFAEMKRGFIARLPGKLDEIRAAMTARSLEDVRMLAHRLRGTCGSYGLTAIGTAMGAIEDRVAEDVASESTWPDVERLIAAAHLAIEEAS